MTMAAHVPSLHKASPVPLYFQLKSAIEQLLDSGQWPPDSQVPSERRLCEQFHISRITVRQALAELLAQIRKLDIRLYLDDFGTGYSSLGYLHRFPIHSLKIHSSFVGQLGKEEDPGQLVRTITTLAENMSMGVVAEGVETREQLAMLRDLRCQRVQGYFFSRPLTAADAELLIAKGPAWAPALQAP